MEGELSLDNILTGAQISELFGNNNEEPENKEPQEDPENKEGKDKDKDTEENKATEVNVNELFTDEPESVGSEENKQDGEGTPSKKGNTSPNFYSSIANALVEDGILLNLDKEELSKITSAEDFADTINNYINNQLDEKQKRVNEALELGIEPSEVKKYEQTVSYLNSLTEDNLTDESEQGEQLRKSLIYQDFMNKGYSQERATKMVERAIKDGTDIEDAKDALIATRTYYQKQYDALINQAKEADKEEKDRMRKQAEELKTAMLNNDKVFGDINIDKNTRQKAYDSITKPIYTDPETGMRLTAIQKYESENKMEFLKNVGLLYVLTDGFKNVDKFVRDKVKKETKSKLRDLETTLKGSHSFNSGNLSLANNIGDNDPESLFKGWQLSV